MNPVQRNRLLSVAKRLPRNEEVNIQRDVAVTKILLHVNKLRKLKVQFSLDRRNESRTTNMNVTWFCLAQFTCGRSHSCPLIHIEQRPHRAATGHCCTRTFFGLY